MIKQFNFYDIYGYLLPGILLLGVFWLPFCIFGASIPEQDLSKALFSAVLAYVLGHLVQNVGASVVPSTVIDSAQNERRLSDQVLDASDKVFSASLKTRLEKQVQKLFGLSLHVGLDDNGDTSVSRDRQAAFFQARTYLRTKKAAGYVEQFEGMYAMMRGLGCSFAAGAAYFAGWALFPSHALMTTSCRRAFALILMLVLAAIILEAGKSLRKRKASAPKRIRDRISTWAQIHARPIWVIVFIAVGFYVGCAPTYGLKKPALSHPFTLFWIASLACAKAASMCFNSYRSFSRNFAETVWRDFAASVAFAPIETPNTGQESEEDED